MLEYTFYCKRLHVIRKHDPHWRETMNVGKAKKAVFSVHVKSHTGEILYKCKKIRMFSVNVCVQTYIHIYYKNKNPKRGLCK